MEKKVVWISSYLPRSCGIAYYSENYINSLKKYAEKTKFNLKIKIISHSDAFFSDYPVIDLKDKSWNLKVLNIIKKEKPDLVHIQHEYGLYETYDDKNQRVIDLIEDIKNFGVPVVMTYHSVYRRLSPFFKHFMSRTLKLINIGFLHCQYQKDSLKENINFVPENVYVLPHGSEEGIKLNREKIREEYGYSGKFVVGSVGLASERKGYLDLIEQWDKVVKKIPNSLLSLELKPEKGVETKIYITKVLGKIMKSKVYRNIEFIVRDYTKLEFYKRLISFDVLVLPYKTESQSGVLAHGFSVGVPAIVTDIEGLGAEIRNSKAGIAVKNRNLFYKAIIRMYSSKNLRKKFSENALNYVKNFNGWSIIAKKTFEIYRKLW